MRRNPIAAENGAQRQARGELAPDDPPPVAQRDLTERQRTDDQRRRLRSRVAAARDDERHEQREHDGPLDLGLERTHRRGRQHLAEEERRQPSGPLLNHPAERDDHVRFVEGLRTADALDVLGRLRFRDVQHVVDGDDADEHPRAVGHGQRRPIVGAELRDRRRLIVGRLQAPRSAGPSSPRRGCPEMRAAARESAGRRPIGPAHPRRR